MFLAAVAAAVFTSRYQVEPDHSLVWQGQPYRPIGVWVKPAELDQALQAGIRDLVVELPSSGKGWDTTFARMEAAKARYLVAVSDPLPEADATVVEPEYYRIPHLKGDFVLNEALPGCHDALVAWVTRDIGASPEHAIIKSAGRVTLSRSLASASSDYTVSVFPGTTASGVSDFWDALDQRRDDLVRAFKQSPPGDGFRGLIDPLGPGAKFPGEQNRVVPRSLAFRNEMAAWLAQTYKNPRFVGKSWGLGSHDLRRFEDFARLVPLWSGSQGVTQVWDTGRDTVFYASPVGSRMWPDLELVCRTSAQRKYSRLVATLRRVTGGPVVQSWVGWSGPYEGQNELDGLASLPMPGPDVLRPATLAASSLARRSFSTWGFNVVEASPATSLFLKGLVDQSNLLGYRGIYFRSPPDKLAQLGKDIAGMEWPASPSAPVTFFPLYSDLLTPTPWNDGIWMLPVPLPGRRIDALGPIDGYSYQNAGTRVAVMWARDGSVDARLRTGESETAVMDAHGIPVTKGDRNATFRLTQSPTTVTFKGPEPAEQSTIEAYATLIRFLNQRMGAVANPTGTSDIALRRAAELSSRAPAEALALVRGEAEDVCARVFPIAWFDITRPESTSAGVLTRIRGSRTEESWSLDQAFALSEGVSAEWRSPRTTVKPGNLWVAARIPEGQGASVEIELNGVKVGSLNEPVSAYGPGFAWYNLGKHPFGPRGQSVVVRNRARERGVAVDAILMTPFDFTPDGGRFPFAMVEKLIRSGKLGQ